MSHIIPEIVKDPICKALSFYPFLSSVSIEFKLVEPIGKSFMQAQPKILTILRPGSKRGYLIKISRKLRLSSSEVPVNELPENVLVGWIGHELGHIVDFESRGIVSMIQFGIGYWLSHRFIRRAEFAADNFAIQQGLSTYLIATKNFILDHTDIDPAYKTKIKRLYMSPEEVLRVSQSAEKVA